MVSIKKVIRKSAVLTPSSLACLSHIPTVNLTSGCAHGCLYCYTRGYRTYPGEGKIILYTNILVKLREELARKRKKPRAVYFSPSSDLFQPLPEVLDLTHEILDFLFKARVGVAFLSKGRIPEPHMDLLRSNASEVRAQVGLTTLDGHLARIFEPHAATPDLRLAQAGELVKSGIVTQVRLDPILPGLTDDEASIEAICAKLADIGVKRIAASTLFLRPAVIHSLKRNLHDPEMLDNLLEQFGTRNRMRIHAERSSVMALPVQLRREIYTRVEQVAGKYGIVVRRCACKNPDLATGSCSIAGDWATALPRPHQMGLFDESERE